MKKINFEAWTWGLGRMCDEINDIVAMLNTKNLTDEEGKKIEAFFYSLEDYVEGLAEAAMGEDL